MIRQPRYELVEGGTQWCSVEEYDRFRNRSEPLVEARSADEVVILYALLDQLPMGVALLRAYRYKPNPAVPPQWYQFNPDTSWVIVPSSWWTSHVPYLGVVVKDGEILLGPSLMSESQVIQHFKCGRFCIASDIPREELTEFIAWHLNRKNYPRLH